MNNQKYLSPLHPQFNTSPGSLTRWGRLYGSAVGLAIKMAAQMHDGVTVVIAANTPSATRLEYELRFFTRHDPTLPILTFPDWETLPYDMFSPHQDIVSERLTTLYMLPEAQRCVLVVPVATVMTRLAPREFLEAGSVILDVGQSLDFERLRNRLDAGGYRCVSTVCEHGEFAVRGGLLDLYPMGSPLPYRVELFDDEIESIRTFDPETQRSIEQVQHICLLPARELPLDEKGITHFRRSFRDTFEGNPQTSTIYRDVSNGIAPAGIEYYLPLFFTATGTLFDYLPNNSVVMYSDDVEVAAAEYWENINRRYEQRRHDIERPLLAPDKMFLPVDEVFAKLRHYPQISLQHFEIEARGDAYNFATMAPPHLTLGSHAVQPFDRLRQFVDSFPGRLLLAAESTGRRETLLEILQGCELYPTRFDSWQDFIDTDARLGITIAPLEQGLLLEEPCIGVITEQQLFGEQVLQRRRRGRRDRDTEAIIRNLTELNIGSPVVHEDHGVGRYLGLQKILVNGMDTEFLALEYAAGDKLYVPVSSLHLISRYTGTSPQHAPLHKLGSGQWERAKRKASEKVWDVAAELLEIYARRAARHGFAYTVDDQYSAFAATFPFEETPDQEAAITSVIADMVSSRPMDRLVCGDVGFGKTEVAMRAAFIAVQSYKQVAILAPTTLLVQQHCQTFKDRLADWPIRVEAISRFYSKKAQDKTIIGLAQGNVDIVIGTHKLLQGGIKFKRLGLVIIDEEHRFGVRQKERFKALRSEVDVLTLTATPIPRTLNMSLADIRDLSIIATPPARRLAIKTFINQGNDMLIQEACQREIKRGGQIYLLHNQVETIDREAREIKSLVPNATVRIAHGQMHERDLERVMLDFYHQRFNILVCTTIIESGIDVPNANTIIINRADRLGLAQLYQLRGRVGRSHHQAYAYLRIPPRSSMTADAIKRLEAIESIRDLGTGFTLATHDLEIRGAGELLGDEQSGHMQEIGFNLYTELLERAVKALKSGQHPELDRPLDHGTEVDLAIPALIPDDYLPDVHARLVMYKRIASAANLEQLRDLQVEMIDRFGLLPESAQNLLRITELKLKATPLKIRKIEVAQDGGRFVFHQQPNIDPSIIIELIQAQPKTYRLDGSDRLRLIKDLPNKEARFDTVEQLLDTLAAKDAA